MKFNTLILLIGLLLFGCSTTEQKNKETKKDKSAKEASSETVQKKSAYDNEEKDTVSNIIRKDFINLCEKSLKRMKSELKEKDKSSYKARIKALKELKKREITATNDDDSTIIVDSLLNMKIAEAKTVKMDSKGIVIAGNILDSANGKLELKSMQDTSGRILILSPQYVYMWPGDSSTACGYLDPRDGYWNVKKHMGYEDPISTISSKIEPVYKEDTLISISQYFSAKRYGWLLIENQKGKSLGWIHQDHVRFYRNSVLENCEREESFYNEGFAHFLHGIWVEPDKHVALASDANGIQFGDRVLWDLGLGIKVVFRGGEEITETLTEDDKWVKCTDPSNLSKRCDTLALMGKISNMKVIPFYKDSEDEIYGDTPNEFVIAFNIYKLRNRLKEDVEFVTWKNEAFCLFESQIKTNTLTKNKWLIK